MAQDHHTNERAVLRGSFTILEETVREDGKEACGVTITNTGSAPTSSDVEIHFTGTGATSDFLCRVDQGNRNPCKYNNKYVERSVLLLVCIKLLI